MIDCAGVFRRIVGAGKRIVMPVAPIRSSLPFSPHARVPLRARSELSIAICGLFFGTMLAGATALERVKIVERGERVSSEAETDTARHAVRPVRVLIASKQPRIRFRSGATIHLRKSRAGEPTVLTTQVWIECAVQRGQLVLDRRTQVGSTFTVASADASPLSVAFYRGGKWSQPREYPGVLRFTVSANSALDVVNEVDIEPYVACVTANEVWPGFHKETMRVQAIVARTYVLYQMKRRNKAPFDVSATQGSQVYRGLRRDTTGENATRAAQLTRGLVLTWFDGSGDRVFCAYYSAACGGHTQSAAIFGPESDIEPLAGGITCDYCRIAPGETYRWGPVRRPLIDVYRRLVARYPDLASLKRLASIDIVDDTDHGRSVTIRLVGSNGKTEDMLAERFRLAIGASELRSTHFRLRRQGRDMVFEDGRGFGHGLGLCQWGAEGQAREGRRAGTILRYYYPGAKLTRAY